MTNIAILTPCVINGDAVSNDVVGMYSSLSKYGYQAKVFAENWGISAVDINHVNKVKSFLTKKKDILIYHYSVGWNTGFNLLHELNCKKVIRYHNVTPAEFYEGISTDYSFACKAGQEQLKSITSLHSAIYLSASEYNAQELHLMGVPQNNSLVLPPFHHIEHLEYIQSDISVIDRYLDDKINVLMVGRIAPNKGHATLIDAFGVYYNTYNKNSRLLIVGKEDERLSIYNNFLHQKVKDLGLQESVIFTGAVSAEALKSYYLVSNIFMTTSEHEGFCVPLVEAMAMKLPIVAYGSTAIPYTVGKAGLVWDKPDPYLLAGSVDCIARDEFVSASLGEMGWRRYKEIFTNEQIETKFIEVIKSLK